MFIILLHIHNDLMKQGNILVGESYTNKPHLKVQKSKCTLKNQNDFIFDFFFIRQKMKEKHS